MDSDYRLINNQTLFEGKIINVEQDIIKLPTGQEAMRETVIHNGGSAILPVDSDGNIFFVRQYRHAAKCKVLEIPAGMLEKGEKAIDCAYRELEEEIGYKSRNITHLTSMYPSVGYCSEVINIYLAENLEKGTQCLDEGEIVDIEKYPVDVAINMIFSGEITDAKTIVGLLLYKEILVKR